MIRTGETLMSNLCRSAVIAGCVCIVVFAARPTAGAPLNWARTPVTVAEVNQAIASELRARLPDEAPSPAWDVDIPLAVPAAGAHKLRVRAVCRDSDGGLLRFHLACSEPGACLPFLAYVRIAAPVPAPSCGIEAAPRTGLPARPIVHAGERATAVLVAAGLRMSAAVTCLESGAPGDKIRVRGEQGRIFRARVGGPGWVEALQP